MRSAGEKKLKYIDSLKFFADSSGCMCSSAGSRRSFMRAMQLRLDRPVKQVLRSPLRRPGGTAMNVEITEITSGLRFPEGPVWMPDGSVLCVELLGGTVVRVQSDGKKAVVSENGGSPNGLAIGPDGAVYVCNSGGDRAPPPPGGPHPPRHPPPGPNGGGPRPRRPPGARGGRSVSRA